MFLNPELIVYSASSCLGIQIFRVRFATLDTTLLHKANRQCPVLEKHKTVNTMKSWVNSTGKNSNWLKIQTQLKQYTKK